MDLLLDGLRGERRVDQPVVLGIALGRLLARAVEAVAVRAIVERAIARVRINAERDPRSVRHEDVVLARGDNSVSGLGLGQPDAAARIPIASSCSLISVPTWVIHGMVESSIS